MSNEEFQKLVLEKLDKLDKRFDSLENRIDEMEAKNSNNHLLFMKLIYEIIGKK